MMAIIGAITRLTESGLSMVEWKPLIGAIPPLNAETWQKVFDDYRQTPEYRFKNSGMSMDDFKNIFFWEWFHRLWGRLIGLVYAVPLLFFIIRGDVRGRLLGRMILLLFLGGFQGFIGWFMVQSGLVDRPSVSHYRLALHLGFALTLYALLLWQGMAILRPIAGTGFSPKVQKIGWVCLGLLTITIIYGAFVAGLDAGQVYNSFPLMNGRFFPEDGLFLQPWALNLVENHGTVQFIHRMLAMITAGFIVIWAILGRRQLGINPITKRIFLYAKAMVFVQIGLGITTLLLHVPVMWGALHQGGAIVLLTLTLCLLFDGRARNSGSRQNTGG